MKQSNNKKKARILGGVSLGVFAVALVLTVVGMSQTMVSIRETAISKTPTAILASAGVSEDKAVTLPVVYYDQKMDECVNVYDAGVREALKNRQFEWSDCKYYNDEIEQGLVEFTLNEEYLPVAVGGRLVANRGVKGDAFSRWFSAVEGKSASYAGTIKMDYKEDGAVFSFYKKDFYPLDAAEFSAGDTVNKDGHNHLFTMNFAVPFTVLMSGDESFSITADDDTFVYVGNQLVLDMGGVHSAATGNFVIHEDGEVYAALNGQDLAYSGVTVRGNEGNVVRIFHADRDSKDSTFNITFSGMNLTVSNTQLAEGGEGDGLQIAYNPEDPSYIAPLGETAVVKPDNSRGLIVMATVLGVLVVLLAVFVMISIRSAIRRRM